jgi:small redox-active disulfide protein 2
MDTNIRKIEILGPGCARCKETFRVVQHIVESVGLTCSVVKEESIQRMIELGVMATPAIVIDGSVVLSGRIPKADEVRQLLGVA